MDLPRLIIGTFRLFIVPAITLGCSFRFEFLFQILSLRAGRAISVVCQGLVGLHKAFGVACLSSILTGGFARTARVTSRVCLGICSRLYNKGQHNSTFGAGRSLRSRLCAQRYKA